MRSYALIVGDSTVSVWKRSLNQLVSDLFDIKVISFHELSENYWHNMTKFVVIVNRNRFDIPMESHYTSSNNCDSNNSNNIGHDRIQRQDVQNNVLSIRKSLKSYIEKGGIVLAHHQDEHLFSMERNNKSSVALNHLIDIPVSASHYKQEKLQDNEDGKNDTLAINVYDFGEGKICTSVIEQEMRAERMNLICKRFIANIVGVQDKMDTDTHNHQDIEDSLNQLTFNDCRRRYQVTVNFPNRDEDGMNVVNVNMEPRRLSNLANDIQNELNSIQILECLTNREEKINKDDSNWSNIRFFSSLNLELQGIHHFQSTSGWDRHCFGSIVLHSVITTSTQTVLFENQGLRNKLPSGSVYVADHQVSGRGRNENRWISQKGCLQFSFVLKSVDPSKSLFIQYLVAISICRALKNLAGTEFPIYIKWPNDIYVKSLNGELTKIGGILVQSSFFKGQMEVVIGCGINVSNPKPTICINQCLLEIKKNTEKIRVSSLTREQVLASILAHFQVVWHEFENNLRTNAFNPFESFLKDYYQFWLHSNQIVNVKKHGSTESLFNTQQDIMNIRLIGLGSDGFLCGIDEQGTVHKLHPDGNSFDLMKGLITERARKD